MADFYVRHFSFLMAIDGDGRIVELMPHDQGASVMLHLAAKSQKSGQNSVKLIFDVADVDEFVAKALSNGLKFGPVHHADGYVFANAKDPDGNPVQVSSRSFRKLAG